MSKDAITEAAPEGLSDLPPTATFIWYFLAQEGRLTQQEIAEGTTIAQRTVRHAVGQLEEIGAVRRWPSTEDARQDYHVALTRHGEPAPTATL